MGRSLRGEISVRTAVDLERRSMGRPIRLEGYRRFRVGAIRTLVILYSCRYTTDDAPPWREYRFAFFNDTRCLGSFSLGTERPDDWETK